MRDFVMYITAFPDAQDWQADPLNFARRQTHSCAVCQCFATRHDDVRKSNFSDQGVAMLGNQTICLSVKMSAAIFDFLSLQFQDLP
jgi:hypothetical protein